jgi:transcriptional regulator with GAF, ATPase, and Fis domain
VWVDVQITGLPAVPEALAQALAEAGVRLRPAGPGTAPLLLVAARVDTLLEAALAARAPRRCAVLLARATATPAALAALWQRWQAVQALVDGALLRQHLVGASAAWRALLRELVEWAHFSDAQLLISGETGTGKELVARAVHSLDTRPDKGELVLVDCTTLASELAGSELFGHERGAFTRAHQARDGALALADGGTLFLDEVGELPLPLQAQLLRAVQEHSYRRFG